MAITTTFTWVGETIPNLANNWLTPADWTVTGVTSVAGFPNLATDAAVVNLDDGGKDAIISNGTVITVGSLSIGGGAIPPTFPAQGGHVLVGGSTTIGGGGGGTLTSAGDITITSTNTGGALVGGKNGVINAPTMTITGGPSVLVGGGGTYNIGAVGGIFTGTIANGGELLGDGGFFDLGPLVLNAGTISGDGFIGVSGPSEVDINAATAQQVVVTVAPSAVAMLGFLSPATFTGSINMLSPTSNADLFFAGATGATFNAGTLIVNAGTTVLDTIALLNAGPVSMTTQSRGGSFEVVVGPGVPAPVPGTVTVSGLHNQYFEASNNGSLYLQDSVPNRDAAQNNGILNTAGDTVIQFADGVGLFDPTGSAEDVSRLYSATLGRGADLAGLQFWAGQIDNGHVPLSQVANAFAASPEFIQSFGTLTDDAFVQQLYQNVLHRAGDQGGLAFWDSDLAGGDSRGDVANSFAQSAENRAATISTAGDVNDAEALRLYQAALGRAPDAAGQQFWSQTLENGATPTQVAQGFVSSAEFQNSIGTLAPSDFVNALYQNVLHRAGDQAGQAFWTSAVTTQGQASVVVGFADSLENRVGTADATHANWVFVG
jgi:hypothetical protein